MTMKPKKRRTRIYVVPGIGESTRAKNYSELIRYARKEGFNVVPVNINWSSKLLMTDYIKQVDKKIPDNISEDYVLGFSFGSYISAILADKKDAKGYIFCSPSPYFKENLEYLPQETKKYWGPKLMKDFRKYTFPRNINNKAWFFMGDKEWKIAQDAIKIFYKKWKGKKTLKFIKGADHELSSINYLKEIKHLIKML
jgi:hypothetical protein